METPTTDSRSPRRKTYAPAEEKMFRDDIQRRIDEAFQAASSEQDLGKKRSLQADAISLGKTLEKIDGNILAGAESEDATPADNGAKHTYDYLAGGTVKARNTRRANAPKD